MDIYGSKRIQDDPRWSMIQDDHFHQVGTEHVGPRCSFSHSRPSWVNSFPYSSISHSYPLDPSQFESIRIFHHHFPLEFHVKIICSWWVHHFLGPPSGHPHGPNFSPRSPVVPTPPAPPQSGAARPRAPPGRGSAGAPGAPAPVPVPGRAEPAARSLALVCEQEKKHVFFRKIMYKWG